MSSHACVFVSPSCNDFTKEQSIKPFDSNASPCHLMRVFCKPILQQPSATHPIFGTNLHFGEFVETVSHEFRLKFGCKCLKWRFVPKMGWVADDWPPPPRGDIFQFICFQRNDLNWIFEMTRPLVLTYAKFSLSRGCEIAQFLVATR